MPVAACLVAAEDKRREVGLERRRPASWVGPRRDAAHPDGHWPGSGRASGCSARRARGWKDLDLVELNEAFALQVLAVLSGWGWSDRAPA